VYSLAFIDSMDFLSKCLYNLHAIGDIPKGQKINTRGECLSAEKDSYFQWAKRLADGRAKVFRDINRYISTVIEISVRTMESRYFLKESLVAEDMDDDPNVQNNNNRPQDSQPVVPTGISYDALKMRMTRIEELKKIQTALLEARRGIAGQQETYKDDTDVGAFVLDLTTKIDQHVIEIKKFLQSVGEKSDDM
jgi:hypothetical protein